MAVDNLYEDPVDVLLAEFNETLRVSNHLDYALLEKCPVGSRKELRSLMNVIALAHKALRRASDRKYQGDEQASA